MELSGMVKETFMTLLFFIILKFGYLYRYNAVLKKLRTLTWVVIQLYLETAQAI